MKKKLQKTRNIMLCLCIVTALSYTAADVVFGWCTAQAYGMASWFDSTLTTELFEFCKWIVVTGATITCTKTIKGE